MRVVKSKPFAVEIVLVSAQPKDLETLSGMLAGSAWKLTEARTCQEAVWAVRYERVPIVLFDGNFGNQLWQESLREFLTARRETCVIFLTNEPDNHLLREITRQGGFDLLIRPLQRDQVFQSLFFAYSQFITSWPVGSRGRSRTAGLRAADLATVRG